MDATGGQPAQAWCMAEGTSEMTVPHSGNFLFERGLGGRASPLRVARAPAHTFPSPPRRTLEVDRVLATAQDIAALAGAAVEPCSFNSERVEDFVGLPAGLYLERRLATEEPGLTMHLPTEGVPVLTYLQKDLAAGWRGRG